MPEGPETRIFTEEELANAEVIGGQYFAQKPASKGDTKEAAALAKEEILEISAGKNGFRDKGPKNERHFLV